MNGGGGPVRTVRPRCTSPRWKAVLSETVRVATGVYGKSDRRFNPLHAYDEMGHLSHRPTPGLAGGRR